ncbi:hypothetical protein EON76_00210 [bacterium]|nr:MAG: hypothetical protein EON76_00210 [bacterium]
MPSYIRNGKPSRLTKAILSGDFFMESNMALSNDLIQRFQAEYLHTYGVPIDANEAEQQLLRLTELVRLTLPKDEEITNEQYQS